VTLFYMVLGWIVGIALTAWKPSAGNLWSVLWIGSVVGGIVLAFIGRKDLNLRQIGLVILSVGLGMWRYSSTQRPTTEADLAYYNDKGYAELVGIVSDAPDVTDSALRLSVDVQRIKQGREEHSISGTVLVRAPRSGDFKYGDKVLIQGEPNTPPDSFGVTYDANGQIVGDDKFSYKDYLARNGVSTFIPFGKVSILERGLGNSVQAALFDIRDRSHHLISQLLPSPQSALLSGILLGDDSDMPPEVAGAFRDTGTSHIIAISGSNITIVIGLLVVLFGPMKRKALATILIVVGIAIYTVFVGASASVVRAAIMGGLALIAQRLGRQSDGLTALAISVWVMTLFNPSLLFDAGLILSSMATLGLILYVKPLTNFTEKAAARLFAAETAQHIVAFIGDAVLITVAAQVTTLPIIFLMFGRFSALGLITNILVVPVQAPIMSIGILAVVAGAIWLPAGQLFGWIVGIPLSYSLAVIRSMAAIPGMASAVSPEPAVIALYYVLLFGVTAVMSQPPERRKPLIARMQRVITVPLVVIGGLAVAALLWAIVISRPDGQLHVWFLAVGQGNAVLIQTPNGAHLLVDGGENPSRLRGALGDRLPFYKREIDALFITQPKKSAIAALPPLFDRYTVKSVITNGQVADDDTYKALSAKLLDQRSTTVIASTGYKLTTDDGVTVEIVNPATRPEETLGTSDAPLVLRLTYGSASFLLTPDFSEDGMQNFIGAYAANYVSVLQLPSNGGEKQNPPDWISAMSPQVAVIEAEAGSQTSQPAVSVLKLLENTQLFRTDLQGTVEISTDGKTLAVRTGK
jgi:competence protein ComEC